MEIFIEELKVNEQYKEVIIAELESNVSEYAMNHSEEIL